MSAQELITDHLDLWTEATATKSNSGRGNSGKTELVGIQKLRELILELATKGKLTIQNPQTESANELMAEVQSIRRGLEDAGKIKKQKGIPPIEHEKLTFSVPKNWTWVRLAELTEKIGSGATPRGGKSAYVTNGVPFFRSQNIWNDGLNLTDVAYIPEETHRKMANTHVYPDDILLNITGASLGRTTIVPSEIEEANVSQHVTIIRIIPPVSIEFIHYLLLSPYVQAMVWGRQVGMAREGLSKKVLELFELPLPPLDEQQRIVQKVDELMVLCDRLEQQTSDQIAAHATLVDTLLSTLTQSQNATELAENWTRLAAHFDTLFTTEKSIDKLKQTILQLAVMGKLIEQGKLSESGIDHLQKISKAKEEQLTQTKGRKSKPLPPIEESEIPFALPQGWSIARLDDITDIQSGIAKGKKNTGKKTCLVPYLRVANVQRAALNLSEIKEIEIVEDDVERYLIVSRDLLITEGGDWDKVGRTAIWEGAISPIIHQNHVFRARLYLPDQSEAWIEKYLNSQFARSYFADSSKQTTNLASINKTQLRSCTIPMPPPQEQDAIIKKANLLFSLCDDLAGKVRKAGETQLHLAETLSSQAISG